MAPQFCPCTFSVGCTTVGLCKCCLCITAFQLPPPEKTPFAEESLPSVLSGETKLKLQFRNDIYGKYDCLLSPNLNLVKASVIYPATQKHIRKYEACPLRMVHETPSLYKVSVVC